MTDDNITISSGSASSFQGEDGVYVLTLVDISEPRTIYPQRGVNAGKEVNLRDWTFAFENGDEITEGASTASGPKSKTFAWLTALLGGQPPQIGQSYPKTQLAGRMALGTIRRDEGGWPRLVNLSAMPASMLQQQFAQATAAPATEQAPAAAAPVTAPAPVAEAPMAVQPAASPRRAAQPAQPVQALQPVGAAPAPHPASPNGDQLPF